MSGPLGQLGGLDTVEAIDHYMVHKMARWCDALVLAMRAENISDDIAARVLNRVVTGMPDPDQVIVTDRIGNVSTSTYDQLRGDIQRAAGRHVGD